MLDDQKDAAALGSMGAHRQFWAGIALISIIPLLVFCYLHGEDFFGSPEAHFRYLILYLLVVALSLTGYLLLRRHSLRLATFRTTLEKAIVSGEVKAASERNPDDIAAIEQYLALLIEKLQSNVKPGTAEMQQLQQLFLAQKIESMSAMATGVAHDFNNALAAVAGNITIAIRGINDPIAKEHAKLAENVTMRAVELANQLLIYAGRGRFYPEKADLSAFVADCSHALRSAVPPNIKIEFQLERNVPEVIVDHDQVRQALSHLVINGADAYAGQSGQVIVRTGVMDCDNTYLSSTLLDMSFPPDKYVFIEVADNGPGVSPELVPKIFDPFFSTKLRGKGLGLAIVLGVARAHFAAIKVASEPGKGSAFRILFQAGRTFSEPL